jgi:7,8-dihydropterin-6-yl-methyl-4-(beta-D-ribofuranosyl)aminobenzene 5'-phosphate synthase
MRNLKHSLCLVLLILWANIHLSAQLVHKLRITILSTMLTDTGGKGEWGFSALVEADGHKMLFDSGTDSLLVLNNAKRLGIDLSDVPVLILSHSHDDHTGGWHVLRKAFRGANPSAYATTYVGEGFFLNRYNRDHSFAYSRKEDSSTYIAEGGQIKVFGRFTQIYPGVYLTGPVPRKYPERNWSKADFLNTSQGLVEDSIPEDMSLVVATDKGLVLLSGCGHSGIINTLSYVQQNLPGKLYAADGGFHLFNADEKQLDFTANYLKGAGMQYFIGAHCTGINVVYDMRTRCGLDKYHCIVGSVGSYFDLATGISAGLLSK